MATTYSDDPFKGLTRQLDREVLQRGGGSLFTLKKPFECEELWDVPTASWDVTVRWEQGPREPYVWGGEKLAMLRFDYEQKKIRIVDICRRHGIGAGYLSRLVKQHGWKQRQPRGR